MKLIGEGMQYKVYDIGECVLKIPISDKKTKHKVMKKNSEYLKLNPDFLDYAVFYYMTTKKIGCKVIAERLVDLRLFAVPRILNKSNVIQNKITPLMSYLSRLIDNGQYSDVNKKIDEIIRINYTLWKCGFSEITFSIDKYGIDKENNIVLYDYSEITFIKDEVRFLVENKWWGHTNRCYHDEAYQIVVKKFDRHITLGKLDEYFLRNYQFSKEFEINSICRSIYEYIKMVRQINNGRLPWMS